MAEKGKNMFLIEPGNPRLLKKPIKDGSEYSLYLEYKIGYKENNGSCIRRKETLSLYIMANPRTTAQRQKNKETIDLARKIRFEREQEFLENKEGYRLKKSRSVNFWISFSPTSTNIRRRTSKSSKWFSMISRNSSPSNISILQPGLSLVTSIKR